MSNNLKHILSHKPLSVWFIGLPCSGKTTLSIGVCKGLKDEGAKVKLLDGDNLRKGINTNLGFSINDRYENIRRVAETSKLFVEEGYVTLNAVICPLDDMRMLARNIVERNNYFEIFVDAPLHICEERDIKGMYRKAKLGEINNFTGIDSPFEPPTHPDVIIKTNLMSIDNSVDCILGFIKSKIMSN